jgi:hypothetical protein
LRRLRLWSDPYVTYDRRLEEMNTMRRTTSTPSRAVPAVLGAFVASIVLGIIGMHALSTHGVMGTTDHSTMTSPVAAPVAAAHGDMSGASNASLTKAVHAGVSSTAPTKKGDGHNLGSMVMLCFAMLAATAGALLLLLLLLGLQRAPRVWAHRPTAPTTVTKWVTARLGTGPPYVWQFSVIRC